MRRAPSSFCSSSSATSSGSRRAVSEVSLPASASMSSSSSRATSARPRRPRDAGGTCFACASDFAAHLQPDAERILERLPDDVGVALLGESLGQRRGLVAEHQRVAVDGADDRTGQHHLDRAAALTHLLAHRRPLLRTAAASGSPTAATAGAAGAATTGSAGRLHRRR